MALPVKHSAKALIVATNDPGQVMLIRERLVNGQLVYDLPGGKLEPGENPEETLQRELKEELSIAIAIGPAIGSYSFITATKPTQIVCQTFLCSLDPAEPVDLTNNPAESEDIMEVVWLPVKEVLETNLPGITPSLKQLIKDYESSRKK